MSLNFQSLIVTSILLFVQINCFYKIKTYDKWINPIFEIKTEQDLLRVIPKKDYGINKLLKKTTETNYLFLLYEDRCPDHKKNIHFEYIEGHFGPNTVLPLSMNKNVYKRIISDWKLHKMNNCSIFIFVPINTYYETPKKLVYNAKKFNNSVFSTFLKVFKVNEILLNNTLPYNVSIIQPKLKNMVARIKPLSSQKVNLVIGAHYFFFDDKNTLLDTFKNDNSKDYLEISTKDRDEWCKEIKVEQTCNYYSLKISSDTTAYYIAKKKEALNYIQSRLVPNFTKIGFTKNEMPLHLFQPILKYFLESVKRNQHVREYQVYGTLNNDIFPTHLLQLSPRQQKPLINFFQNELAKWTGFHTNNLTFTSVYGIRIYTRGAILNLHVDSCSTHVFSAILHVASKSNKKTSWPLQIYDHNDTLHSIEMQSGEYVLYESSKLAHARFIPFAGRFYANVFIHFMPPKQYIKCQEL